jgi:hypothetical protein
MYLASHFYIFVYLKSHLAPWYFEARKTNTVLLLIKYIHYSTYITSKKKEVWSALACIFRPGLFSNKYYHSMSYQVGHEEFMAIVYWEV